MDLTLSWRILRRWWWVLIAATVAGGALAYGLSLHVTPTYQATTTLLVTQRPSEGVVQLNDLQTAKRLANTFSRLVTLRPVLEHVAEGPLPFTVDELDERLSVSNPAGTQLLEVSARSSELLGSARMDEDPPGDDEQRRPTRPRAAQEVETPVETS